MLFIDITEKCIDIIAYEMDIVVDTINPNHYAIKKKDLFIYLCFLLIARYHLFISLHIKLHIKLISL